ncbi:hypothetical protein [Kutzneria sp. 744]|uniref:hypothetical protein n=1 Tax=Kutzneria sp. (strain 744) TaxID=345341 RepID=UPI0003EEA409|nr:hypothetical protein [Kutzneria sp. 744]EWM18093.1 hypothetical protein KUTG_08397 [Kutzneria sp. 744]
MSARQREDRVGTFAWIFGFAGKAQFGLVAGQPSVLAVADQEQLYGIARAVSDSCVAIAGVAGIADRLRAWDVVAVGLPVDVVERFSERTGISIVLCCGVSRSRRSRPRLLVQAMLGLRETVCVLFGERKISSSSAFERLAMMLQDDVEFESGPLDGMLDKAVADLARRLDQLALSRVNRWWPFWRHGPEVVFPDHPDNGVDSLAGLCRTLTDGLAFDKRAQIGYFLPLTPPFPDVPHVQGVLTTYERAADGVFVCTRWHRR